MDVTATKKWFDIKQEAAMHLCMQCASLDVPQFGCNKRWTTNTVFHFRVDYLYTTSHVTGNIIYNCCHLHLQNYTGCLHLFQHEVLTGCFISECTAMQTAIQITHNILCGCCHFHIQNDTGCPRSFHKLANVSLL